MYIYTLCVYLSLSLYIYIYIYIYIICPQENVIKRNQVEHTKTERNVLEVS